MKAFAIIQAQTFVPLLLPSICLFSFFSTYIFFLNVSKGIKMKLWMKCLCTFIYFFSSFYLFYFFFFIWNVKLSFKYYWHIYRWVEGEWKQNFLSQFDQLNMMEIRLDMCTCLCISWSKFEYCCIWLFNLFNFSVWFKYLPIIINC